MEAGTAVRTLQEFLVTARWNHQRARDLLQRHLLEAVAALPADPLGIIGVLDETSCQKWGDQTPAVQRQYLGCLGKIDNGIVTVHVGVAKGCFHALLDADRYLPKVWAAARPRCRAAGVPDAEQPGFSGGLPGRGVARANPLGWRRAARENHAEKQCVDRAIGFACRSGLDNKDRGRMRGTQAGLV